MAILPLWILLVQPLQKLMVFGMNFISIEGGSDPRSEDTSEAGLWRLDRPQTGVAPALFTTPRAVLCRPRLLVEVVFSPLVTDDNRRTVPRTASGPNQLWKWSADPARFHAGVIRQRSPKSLWSV